MLKRLAHAGLVTVALTALLVPLGTITASATTAPAAPAATVNTPFGPTVEVRSYNPVTDVHLVKVSPVVQTNTPNENNIIYNGNKTYQLTTYSGAFDTNAVVLQPLFSRIKATDWLVGPHTCSRVYFGGRSDGTGWHFFHNYISAPTGTTRYNFESFYTSVDPVLIKNVSACPASPVPSSISTASAGHVAFAPSGPSPSLIDCLSSGHARPTTNGWHRDPCANGSTQTFSQRLAAGTDFLWSMTGGAHITAVRGCARSSQAAPLTTATQVNSVTAHRAGYGFSGQIAAGGPVQTGTDSLACTNQLAGVGCGGANGRIGTTSYGVKTVMSGSAYYDGSWYTNSFDTGQSYFLFATDGSC